MWGQPPRLSTDANGQTVLVAGETTLYAMSGVIILAKPTTDGVSTSLNQSVTSQTVTSTMSGEKLLYSTVVRDDFGDMAARILTNPGEILVPAGAVAARFTASVAFPAEATATGIRWARVLSGASTHRGNFSRHPTGVTPDVCTVTGAIMPVTPGDYYWVGAIQNSGGSLQLGSGNASNNWASNWFQAEFFS
jgi:hypothetical protein